MERFNIFKQFYAASLLIKTFLITRNTDIFTKLSGVSKISIKINARSHGTLLVVFLTSAVIFKQILFHGNKIRQFFQNRKCHDVVQDYQNKAPIKFCKIHEKELSLSDTYSFQMSFNFRLRLTFRLS